jgi:PadR family transcriptional regulator PadR
MADDALSNNLLQELKRGTLTLSVLLMTDKPAYGYSLVTELQNAGIEVEQNTLYPLLRRLESQGLLQSSWDTAENRPRKYYSITDDGRTTAGLLGEEWRRINRVIIGMTKEEGK